MRACGKMDDAGYQLSLQIQQIDADHQLALQLQKDEDVVYGWYEKVPMSATQPNVASSEQSDNLVYQFRDADGAITCFQLMPTPGDGDCFFHAIGLERLTRNALVKTLINNENEGWVRSGYAYEIMQFLFIGRHGHASETEQEAYNQLLTDQIRSRFTSLDAAQEQLRLITDETRRTLDDVATAGKTHKQLQRLLQSNKHHLATKFSLAYDKFCKIEQKILAYCCNQSVFKEYVLQYLSTARGYIPFRRKFKQEKATTTLDVINKLFGLNIQIYMQNANQNYLELINPNQVGTGIHIFHDGINHFSQLRVVEKNKQLGKNTSNIDATPYVPKISTAVIIKNDQHPSPKHDSSLTTNNSNSTISGNYDEYGFLPPYNFSTEHEDVTQEQINQISCPIGKKIMNDPVILPFLFDDNGTEMAASDTYEKEQIVRVIAEIFFQFAHNLPFTEDTQGYILWPGIEPTLPIKKEHLHHLVKNDYSLSLMVDIIQTDPKKARSETIYLSPTDGTYYIKDRWDILQSGKITNNLIPEIQQNLTNIDLNVALTTKIINDIIPSGHTMLIVSNTSKKQEILNILKHHGIPDTEVYLPESWKNAICNLICDTDTKNEHSRKIAITNYLKKDPRLLTVTLNYPPHVYALSTMPHVDYTNDANDDIFNFIDIGAPIDNNSKAEIKIASTPPVQCSAFYLAGMFGSFTIVLHLLEHLKSNNCVTILQDGLKSISMQPHPCLLHIDRALKESLYLQNSNDSSNTKNFNLLLQLGANIAQTDPAGNTLLHEIVSSKLDENVLLQATIILLKNTSSLLNSTNNDGNTPLHLAILADNSKLFNLLLTHKASTTTKNNVNDTPLHLAVRQNNCTVVETLCQYGARDNLYTPNNAQQTPFFIASTEKRVEILQYFLEKFVGTKFIPPLHLAIEIGDSQLLSWWLQNNSNLETSNQKKQTPLYLAVVKQDLAAIQILLDKGADLNVVPDKSLKQTLFHIAADNPAILELLLAKLATKDSEHQLIINSTDSQGNTPLHLAVKHKNQNSMQLLIYAGAITNIPNNEGLIASEVAQIPSALLLSFKEAKYNNHNYDNIIRKKMTDPNSKCLSVFKPLAANILLFGTDAVQIFNTNEKKTLLYLPKSTNPKCICILSNNNIVSTYNENEIHIWDLANQGNEKKQPIATLCGHTNPITCLQEINDNRLASVTDDGCIKIWNYNTYKCLYTIKTNKDIKKIRCFASNKNTLACGTKNGHIQVWDCSTDQYISSWGFKYDAGIRCLQIVEELLIIGFYNGIIKVLSLNDGLVVSETLEYTQSPIYCIIISDISAAGVITLISASKNGIIKEWHLSEQEDTQEGTAERKLECIHSIERAGCKLLDHRPPLQNILVMYTTSDNYSITTSYFEELLSQNTAYQNTSNSCYMM